MTAPDTRDTMRHGAKTAATLLEAAAFWSVRPETRAGSRRRDHDIVLGGYRCRARGHGLVTEWSQQDDIARYNGLTEGLKKCP
jgi:hypothetical protein